jgi:hypothetical protein
MCTARSGNENRTWSVRKKVIAADVSGDDPGGLRLPLS